MKKSNDTIGNRTRDLPACSAVPQPTALPRAPHINIKPLIFRPTEVRNTVFFSRTARRSFLLLGCENRTEQES